MRITKIYCPHCGELYRRYTNHDPIKTGCPIVTCLNCRMEFFDKKIKEYALIYLKPKPINLFKILCAPLYPFGIGGALFLIGGIKSTNKTLSILFSIFGIFALSLYAYLIYIGIKKKEEISADMMDEYNQSKKRLSDRDYVIDLINHRYRVPKSFLRKNYPDLLNYKRNRKKGI